VKALAIAAIALLVPSVAFASSDGAWNDLAKAAKTACTAQIKKHDGNLTTISVAGTVLGIGGRDGEQFYGLMLNGKAKQYSAKWMCIYDKRAKTASAGDITS